MDERSVLDRVRSGHPPLRRREESRHGRPPAPRDTDDASLARPATGDGQRQLWFAPDEAAPDQLNATGPLSIVRTDPFTDPGSATDFGEKFCDGVEAAFGN